MNGKYIIDSNILSLYAAGRLNRSAHKLIHSVLGERPVIPITPEVKQVAVKIRKLYKTKLPDAIIAATAITENATLLTINLSDFSKIEGLNIRNPEFKP